MRLGTGAHSVIRNRPEGAFRARPAMKGRWLPCRDHDDHRYHPESSRLRQDRANDRAPAVPARDRRASGPRGLLGRASITSVRGRVRAIVRSPPCGWTRLLRSLVLPPACSPLCSPDPSERRIHPRLGGSDVVSRSVRFQLTTKTGGKMLPVAPPSRLCRRSVADVLSAQPQPRQRTGQRREEIEAAPQQAQCTEPRRQPREMCREPPAVEGSSRRTATYSCAARRSQPALPNAGPNERETPVKGDRRGNVIALPAGHPAPKSEVEILDPAREIDGVVTAQRQELRAVDRQHRPRRRGQVPAGRARLRSPARGTSPAQSRTAYALASAFLHMRGRRSPSTAARRTARPRFRRPRSPAARRRPGRA